MRPDHQSQLLLGVTRSKAKMYEYSVPEEHHIEIRQDPARLFRLALSILGDLSALIDSKESVEDYEERLAELREQMQFSAKFFDSYLESRLNEDFDIYLLLVGAASYYLCDLPGSSSVLSQRINTGSLDVGCQGLEALLHWLLSGDISTNFNGGDGEFERFRDKISQLVSKHYINGENTLSLIESLKDLRKTAYECGTDRQLLISDVICAVVYKKLENSTWHCLPLYTGLPGDYWASTIEKESFIHEFWPAQHMLGQQGVFNGKSAVVQMPTSAGKTKSIEIIIRSAFLSNRSSLAVIVAPFRALCHEIRANLAEAFLGEPVGIDEPSDVMQMDIQISELLGVESRKKILIVTPEKLFYILRQSPELSEHIGLLVYDEGHQFDSGSRGITYELLLSSLKTMMPENTQTILISAVISNAVEINSWLNGENSEVIIGNALSPTFRSIAFASWQEQLGRLYFVNKENPDRGEFFVPRLIEEISLALKPRERSPRIFPAKSDGKSIALYLGLKLIHNGPIAIFCGQKSSVTSICSAVVDKYERGLPLPMPIEYSDQEEMQKLYYHHVCHFGEDDEVTQSAKIGVLAHSANTPQGLRLAVEHAMREGRAGFVVCTSTLAQGVNLPIRYLIVTSIYQAGQKISVRDFHNLIGRAGRSGMHTEGSIIFSDPIVYDNRNVAWESWRWNQSKDLLDPNNAEPCVSKILAIFDPFYSDDMRTEILMEPLDFTKAYIAGINDVGNIPNEVIDQNPQSGFTVDGLTAQITFKINIIGSIESFLMSHWDDTEAGLNKEMAADLAKETLAYFLSDELRRSQIVELFTLLTDNISEKVSTPEKRKSYGRTLYGVQDSLEIEAWVLEHLRSLVEINDQDELMHAVWPIVCRKIKNKTFKKCNSLEALENLTHNWINGVSFHEILSGIKSEGAKLIAKSQTREYKIGHIVEVCENALAFDGMLIIGAISEVVSLTLGEDAKDLIRSLQELQKRLKYGLPNLESITLFELGFADRVVSSELALFISPRFINRKSVLQEIKNNEQSIRGVLDRFPSYYSSALNEVLNLQLD